MSAWRALAQWLYLLEQGYKDEREMEVLTEMTEGMKAFARKYNRSLDDPKLRGLYERDMSARRDCASARRDHVKKWAAFWAERRFCFG